MQLIFFKITALAWATCTAIQPYACGMKTCSMNGVPSKNSIEQRVDKNLWLVLFVMLMAMIPANETAGQCNPASSFTKITNTSGTATYPGTNGSPAVAVTTTSTGDVGAIGFCNITNGFRAGVGDRSGAYRFAFSPAVNGIAINLNALSNTPGDREVVQIRINDVLYTVTAANIVCSGTCFSCSGVNIVATGGAITAAVSATGNGVGQLLIQGAGLISSIEYINVVQADDPEGSVFDIFFNNSSCLLPVNLTDFKAFSTIVGVQVSWIASTEMNVNHYQLERSADGTNFKTIVQVPATNSGNYRYEDATAAAGTNYYRLKINDKDGSYQFSKTVQIARLGKSDSMVFQNPVTDVLKIAGLSGNSNIAVYTIAGKQMAQIATSNFTETIRTANWPAGIYIVRIINGGRILPAEKLMKL